MRKQPVIKTSSWVPVGGEMIELTSLPPEKKRKWATETKKLYMNTMFRGRAVFWAEGEPEPEISG